MVMYSSEYGTRRTAGSGRSSRRRRPRGGRSWPSSSPRPYASAISDAPSLSVPFSWDEVLDQPRRSYLDAPLRWMGSEVFRGILRERPRGYAEFLEEGAGCDISAQGEGHRRIGDRSVQFVPESPESLLVLPGRDPVHARETVWRTRLSERNGLAEVPDLGQDEFLQVDFLLEVRPEVSNRLAIAQDDSISLQEFRIARDQRGNVRRFSHGPTEQASRILSEQPLDGRDVVARRPSESKVARMRALSRHGPIGSIERGEVDVPHLLVDPIPANVPTRREGGEPQSFAQEPFVSPLHRRPRESLAPPRWMGTDARDRAHRLLARPKADPHVERDHLRHDLSVFDRVEGEPVEAPRVDSADLPDLVLGEIPAGGRHAELPHGPRVDLIVRHDSHRSTPRIASWIRAGRGI